MKDIAMIPSSNLKQSVPGHYEDILKHGILKQLSPMDILFREGEDSVNCYLVTKGCLKLSKANTQGREVIIRYISSGYMTAAPALLRNREYPVTAQAIKTTEVVCWNKKGFIDLTRKYPDIALDLLMTVFDRLDELQTRYLKLSSEQTEQRIAKLMISLMKHAGKRDRDKVHIDIPLSRQNIADHIGASIYTVSRTLSTWEKSGWIKSSRKQITIIDPHTLEELGTN